jgi:hypothetical protein
VVRCRSGLRLLRKFAFGLEPVPGHCRSLVYSGSLRLTSHSSRTRFVAAVLHTASWAGRLNSGVRGQMNRQDVFAAFTSLALALALAYGLDAYTTPHDLTETNPSAVALFSGWLMAITTNLAPPIVLGALARRKVILSACLLAIATVAAHTYFSVHRMYYPNILGELFEHIIQYIFMALGALYLKQGLSSNNSFKPNPLRSFKTPSGFSGGSA